MPSWRCNCTADIPGVCGLTPWFGPALVRVLSAHDHGRGRTITLKRRRHSPEQVIRKLREADRMVGEGKTVPEVARALEVSENTYHRWQRQFGGMKADDAKRLKELERENARLSGSSPIRCSRTRRSRRSRRET